LNDFGSFDVPKYFVILFCGCCWFVALKLYAESHKWSFLRYCSVGVPIFVAIALHIYTNPSWDTVIFLSLGLVSSIFVAPFINKKGENLNISLFNYNLLFHLRFSIFATIILWICIFLLLACAEFLLSINFNSKIYPNTAIIIFTFIAPLIVMSGIPTTYDAKIMQYYKGVQFILTYIILPFLLIYSVLLYIYSAKILVEFRLPENKISYLVINFGGLGIITYLLNYPFSKVSKISAFFHNTFFKIILVPIILFAIAISTRVYEFGLTEKRYIVILLLIWFVLSTLFTLFNKDEKELKFILLSIVILLIASSFGIAEQLSTWSQTKRLEKVLVKNNILINGKIHKFQGNLDNETLINISSIVDYLIANNKRDKIKSWFPDNAKIKQNPGDVKSIKVLADMGLKYRDRNIKPDFSLFEFGNKKIDNSIILVKGYDYHLKINSESVLKSNEKHTPIITSFDQKTNVLRITNEKTSENFEIDFNDIIKQLHAQTTDTSTPDLQDLIIEKAGQSCDIKLILNKIEGAENSTNKNLYISLFSADLLVRLK
jgi:hypothetical protein